MPWPNRTYAEWKKEVNEDIALILTHLESMDAADVTKEQKTIALAAARKEARRLARDIERIGSECLDISKDDLDAVRL